jgi:hypothetical protein
MSKKMMLLALAAISAVMFVLPAAASANWGVTPGNVEFHGTGPVGSLYAANEPTIKCEGPNTSTGKYDGTGTTGTISLHFTKCSTTIIFRFPCSNTASPSSETITTAGTFHNVTITGGKRGVLVTPNTTVIKCESVGNAIDVTGAVIGEVTSPTAACPVKTKTLGLKFAVTATNPRTQVHETTDGHATEYDLLARTTPEGAHVTAALEATATNTFTQEVTIDCNTP